MRATRYTDAPIPPVRRRELGVLISAMSRRFFSAEPLRPPHATLAGPEAHHLINVMRAEVGDEIVLFDGNGYEFDARVDAVSRKTVSFELLSRRDVDRELSRSLEFAVALPRGDRSDWLVQKLVELGVTRLTPWKTARSVSNPNEKSVKRLQRQVIEASKQCGRNRLLEIGTPRPMLELLKGNESANRLIAHPRDQTPLDVIRLSEFTSESPQPTVIGIGPEGGFTDDEVELAIQHGWRCVDLGERILRTETAAIAIAAWFMLEESSAAR